MDKTHISNPLTIIGVFCSLAEISGTVILVNVSGIMQWVFLGFVIGFPVLLLVLFFKLLNSKNYHRLYSPKDYDNSEVFMRIWEKAEAELEKATAAMQGEDPAKAKEKADAHMKLAREIVEFQDKIGKKVDRGMFSPP